jgi:hypothetical protein
VAELSIFGASHKAKLPGLSESRKLSQRLSSRDGFKTNDHPRMITFLDQNMDEARVALASPLEIAVVIKSGDDFQLLNPGVSPELQAVFSPIAKAANV